MIKLIIMQNDEYANYVLKDNKNNDYYLNINFMNMEKPKVGTEIIIPKKVIKEDVSLNYGEVDKDNTPEEDELMILSSEGKEKYLQRFYG